MRHYLGSRLLEMSRRLMMVSNYLASAGSLADIEVAIEMLETASRTLRIYQYEWQKQVIAGASADHSSDEVGRASMGGLIRID